MTNNRTTSHLLPISELPESAGATLNPFAFVDGASGFVTFLVDVLGGVEVTEARTPTPDGRLIHAEVVMNDAHLLITDRFDGWLPHPGLFQLWVDDVAATLDDAVSAGARVVTPATPFFLQTTLGRMVDPWGNLWWLYSPTDQPDATPFWETEEDVVFSTIDTEMRDRALLTSP